MPSIDEVLAIHEAKGKKLRKEFLSNNLNRSSEPLAPKKMFVKKNYRPWNIHELVSHAENKANLDVNLEELRQSKVNLLMNEYMSYLDFINSSNN